MASQNISAPHQGTELQYLPYPLQSRPFIPYQSTQQQLNPQLTAPRNSNQFNRTDPFIHVSSIVVPGIQGRLELSPPYYWWNSKICVGEEFEN